MKGITDRNFVVGLLIVSFVSTVFFSKNAIAEDGASKKKEDELRLEARERYKKGKQYYDESDYEKALVEFEAAYEARPHPVVLKSVAECNVMLNRIPEAIANLEKFLEDPESSGKAEVKKRLEEIKRLLATVEVNTEPAGAVISLDGVGIGKTTPAVLDVGAGHHEIVLSVDGYEPLTKKLVVDSGQKASLEVNFALEGTPLEPETPGNFIDPFEEEEQQQNFAALNKSKSGPPVGFWVCAALAGVGLVSGTVFGTLALNTEEDYKKDHSPAKKEAGEREAIIADVSFGVALASAIVGTIIIFTYDRGEKKEELARPRDAARFRLTGLVGKDAAGLNAVVSF